jgi:phenylalanyl-tRNA synthetase alpha chain
MGIKPISPEKADRLRALPDLTDPAFGTHAVNLALSRIVDGFTQSESYPDPIIFRHPRVMNVEDNFDRLLFPQDLTVRTSLHTYYLSEKTVLRSQTSSMIPLAIQSMQDSFSEDTIVCCPGICFRNSRGGVFYSGEPHQVDIWRFTRGNPLNTASLNQAVSDTIDFLFQDPDKEFQCIELDKDISLSHPYLSSVFKMHLRFLGNMVSIGEAGIVNQTFLESVGLGGGVYSAIAIGIMLDRAVMMIKKLNHIKLLRESEVRTAQQMQNLDVYKPVSKYPSIARDLSVVVDASTTPEDLTQLVHKELGEHSLLLEDVEAVSETPYDKLHAHVQERLSMSPHEKNILLRLIFRSHERTLRKDEVDTCMGKVAHALNVQI